MWIRSNPREHFINPIHGTNFLQHDISDVYVNPLSAQNYSPKLLCFYLHRKHLLNDRSVLGTILGTG